jgi:protein-tyrosine phosphatase
MARILLVCTGNICRSPMAEAFIRRELGRRGVEDVQVESAGVSGWADSPATAEAVAALVEYDVDITPHRARRLDRETVDAADVIVGLTSEHRDTIARVVPHAAPRTFTLKELVALLEAVPPATFRNDGAGRMVEAVRAAQVLREQGTAIPPDQDVVDPLGLGFETYRAVAWEIEGLSRRLVDGLFGGAASSPEERADPARTEAEGGAG